MKQSRIVLPVLLVLALLVALVSCKEGTHTHTYADAWTSDADYHWHAATCGHADEVKDKAAHTYENGSCTVCGRAEPEGNLDPSTKLLEYLLLPDGTWSVSAGRAKLLDKIVIPTTWEGKAVTAISAQGFLNCTNLTSITIPSGVTSIDSGAFKGCTSLTSITIAEGVTSIGDEAFSGCTSLTSITIPEGVTSIGYRAFYDCTSLTSITIPSSVTSIGKNAFSYCTSLTSITIAEGVTSIGNWAFSGCTSLTSITIPEGVTSIGNSAFSVCTSLTSITIPSSVKSIGSGAFSGCYKLVEVYNLSKLNITVGLSSYGDVAYYAKVVHTSKDSASKLKTDAEGYLFYENGDEAYLIGYTGAQTNLTLPEKSSSGKAYDIYRYAFKGCTSLTSITIPEGVTSIGREAFSVCTSLTSITYSGTKEQWNRIEKGYGWAYDTGYFVVHCTDGDIAKSDA